MIACLPVVFLLLITAVAVAVMGNAGSYLDANLQRDLIKLLLAIIVAYAIVMKSRWLDRRAGINFKDAWNDIRKDNRAVALYLGLRWIGICLLGLGILLLA